MKNHPKLWVFLQRILRTLQLAIRIMHPGGEIGRALQEMARQELRPEDEIAADLLRNAVLRHQAAEANLRRWHELTPREQEVSALACLNLTNTEIANYLTVSPETVKTHIRNVLAKFNLRSKSELRQILGDWDFSAWVETNIRRKNQKTANQEAPLS
ncbi:MAG: response regulator transcription factor [Chloroflexota bacterium]|nr:MAG: response regulator transcription factor [Chloroflexota bacterium]